MARKVLMPRHRPGCEENGDCAPDCPIAVIWDEFVHAQTRIVNLQSEVRYWKARHSTLEESLGL